MSDAVDYWRDMKEWREEILRKHGVPCPECVSLLPKANPTILLPQQRCRIHGYVDPRPGWWELQEAKEATK